MSLFDRVLAAGKPADRGDHCERYHGHLRHAADAARHVGHAIVRADRFGARQRNSGHGMIAGRSGGPVSGWVDTQRRCVHVGYCATGYACEEAFCGGDGFGPAVRPSLGFDYFCDYDLQELFPVVFAKYVDGSPLMQPFTTNPAMRSDCAQVDEKEWGVCVHGGWWVGGWWRWWWWWWWWQKPGLEFRVCGVLTLRLWRTCWPLASRTTRCSCESAPLPPASTYPS